MSVIALLGAGVLAAGCGSSASARPPQGDWPTFDFNAQRSGVGPRQTGITRHNLGRLRRTAIRVSGGVVDSAPILLHAVRVRGRVQTVFIVTTDYGRTVAYNASSGRRLWQYTPRSLRQLLGSAQITTATPVADPNRRFVYAASPDGFVQKLRVSDGSAVWRRRVTFDAAREKLAGALNVDGSQVVAVTGGYYGDAPTYQGHVVTIDRASGRITHVWNSLCSDIHRLIDPPSRCPASDSAIWGRPGSVVEPGSGRLLIATGNGPFNGRSNWGDSVLELTPALRLLGHWTPFNHRQLEQQDTDLGSTEPALLPVTGGRRYAVQGGKDGLLRLLNLDRLRRGALQTIAAPGPTDVFGQPVVWSIGHGRAYVFVSDGAGTAAYMYGYNHRLRRVWHNGVAANNPVLAGGLLYVYAIDAGRLEVINPRNGRVIRSLPAAGGHWNSPIVVDGRIVLPVGNDNGHRRSGTIFLYRPARH